MQARQTYSDVYEQLLLAKDLQSLPKFKTSRSGLLLYPDAQKIPEFFKNNLLRSGRVIKVVRGKSALLRAFIYQLMKLTFEIEADNRVNYVEVLKGIIFHPTFLQEDGEMLSPISGRGCNDKQYKRIIADFIELMENQSIPNFELTLMEYPIVDQALTRTFQTYVTRCYHNQLTTLTMLEWLCETFAVTLQCYGKCYHFKEPDIFLYQQEPNQFFLAFVNEMAEVSDYSESTYRFQDIKNMKDRSRKARDWDGSIPDSLNQDADLQYRNPEDRFRNSAEPLGRRLIKEAQEFQGIPRKTFRNSDTIRELAKEVDESIHEKPSDGKSKIGSLLEIMSDRSKQDLFLLHRSPEISSSRHFSQQQRRYIEPLTTRTAQFDFKSQLQEIMEEKHQSNVQQQQINPQLTKNIEMPQEYYNPFTKKYSDIYMPHMYSKQIDYNQNNQKQDFKFYTSSLKEEPYRSQFIEYSKVSPEANLQNNYYDSFNKYHIKVNNQPTLTEEKRFGSYQSDSKPLVSNLTTFKAIQDVPKKNINIEVQQQDLIYRPKGKSKIVIQGQDQEHKNIQDTKGTIYRQFTDTRVLEMMASYEKMKTNMIRQRFRGVHQRDLYNPRRS